MKQISIKIISPVILLLISTSVFTQENLDELELSKYYKHLHLARNHCFQGSKVNAKKEYNKALLILKDNTTKKYRAIYEEMLSTKKCKEIDQVAHRRFTKNEKEKIKSFVTKILDLNLKKDIPSQIKKIVNDRFQSNYKDYRDGFYENPAFFRPPGSEYYQINSNFLKASIKVLKYKGQIIISEVKFEDLVAREMLDFRVQIENELSARYKKMILHFDNPFIVELMNEFNLQKFNFSYRKIFKNDDEYLKYIKSINTKIKTIQIRKVRPFDLDYLLMSPFYNFYSSIRGGHHHPREPFWVKVLFRLTKNKNYIALENSLRGVNREGAVFSAVALLYLSKKGYKLSKETKDLIDLLRRKKVPLPYYAPTMIVGRMTPGAIKHSDDFINEEFIKNQFSSRYEQFLKALDEKSK
ncbi:MAG: hypothetical protein CME70_17090 [Halobacteriovorax sp.]|nr:hypothetical protein [Halobacteriovorax sp.]|tara:strand:+ start:116345 stop:117577 length:1233 start_codon:yes stop_codon:yes gene_type:complete